jgi:competence protein ComEC
MNISSTQTPSFWHHNPLTRQLLFLTIGIGIANNCSISIQLSFWLGCLLLIVSYLTIRQKGRFRNALVSKTLGLTIWFLCIFLGCFLCETNKPINHPYFAKVKILYRTGIFKLKINSQPIIIDSTHACKFNADLLSYKDGNNWMSGYGKVKCKITLPIDSIRPQLGQTIYLSGTPKFPGFLPPRSTSFNYRDWLIQNNFIATLNATNWKLPKQQAFSIMGFASSLRESSLQNFKSNESLSVEGELAGALLLGDRVGIDPEISQTFIDVGIIHLLSVSGLHVVLVFQALIFILSLCLRGNRFELLVSLLSIGCIWFYSLTTGMSPSVCRASLMLSITIIGKIIHRKIPSFNVLSSAAFILIVNEPQIISDLGFLLSFSAVFGILAVNQYTNKTRKIKNTILRAICGSCIISISAQLATLPITIYYFGRFPIYFLIANLVAIPLASIISYIGFIALVFQSIPSLGEWLIWLCLKGIGFLVSFSKLISALPNPSLFFESQNLIKLIIISWLTLMILMSAQMSSKLKLQISLIIILGCSLISFMSLFGQSNKSKLHIETIHKETNFTYLSRGGSLFKFKLGKEGFYDFIDQKNVFSEKHRLSVTLKNANASLIFAHPKYTPRGILDKRYRILVFKNLNPDKLLKWITLTRPTLLINLGYSSESLVTPFESSVKIDGIPLWNIHKINTLTH